MDEAIRRNVTWSIGGGTTIVKFVIASDGKIELANIKTDKTSGVSTVDNDAIFAVRKATLPPLPKEYSKPSLTVFLTIKYP
jgi:TonB family protein